MKIYGYIIVVVIITIIILIVAFIGKIVKAGIFEVIQIEYKGQNW